MRRDLVIFVSLAAAVTLLALICAQLHTSHVMERIEVGAGTP